MIDLKNKKITILGSQRSGRAVGQLVVYYGGQPRFSDQADFNQWPNDVRHWINENGIEYEAGGHHKNFFLNSDMLVISPGIPIKSKPVQWARDKNIPVLGEIEFANQFQDATIIAVTGSNGKTTVVNLIHKILLENGNDNILCGNVGYPFAEAVLNQNKVKYFVLEISSFQMESLASEETMSLIKNNFKGRFKPFKPKVAMILNFSENHLDRHANMREYLSAKSYIFKNQDENDFSVINGQSSDLRNAIKGTKSQRVLYESVGDDKNINFRASRCVARLCGVEDAVCDNVYKSFKGIEHRLEEVVTFNGIRFINDSKATTAEAARWALDSLSHNTIRLICGGRDKGIDFSSLREIISNKVKKIYAIGDARMKILSTFNDCVGIQSYDSLKEAVWASADESVEGDIVLFSPMCASFDMFKNYEERGQIFKKLTRQWVSQNQSLTV